MTFTARICLRGPGYVMYVGHLPPKVVDELQILRVVRWERIVGSLDERRGWRKQMTQPRWYGG